MKLRPIVLILAGFAVAGDAALREVHAGPATQPTSPSSSVPVRVADLISRLGDADPAAREEAALRLWLIGRPAEGALRQAADGDDPELAARARTLVDDLWMGMCPDS